MGERGVSPPRPGPPPRGLPAGPVACVRAGAPHAAVDASRAPAATRPELRERLRAFRGRRAADVRAITLEL